MRKNICFKMYRTIYPGRKFVKDKITFVRGYLNKPMNGRKVGTREAFDVMGGIRWEWIILRYCTKYKNVCKR